MTDISYATPEQREQSTLRLADGVAQENIIVLNYGDSLLEELGGLSNSKRLFDVVVIDCTHVGFFFTAETFIQCGDLAKTVLEVQGAMVFVKSDKAVAIVKESVVGNLRFLSFETLAQVYDYSPSLARHIQNALGKKTDMSDDASDLSEQILMSSVPVLTPFGIKMKASMESNRRRNMVLAAVDNYTPLSSLIQKLNGKISFEELLEELKQCEESGAVFPIFARIPFLVHYFRNKLPFKLKDYLLESRLLTADQLDGLIVIMQSGSDKLSLGALSVSKGLITSRALEIALQDQAFYGQSGDKEKVKIMVDQDQESKVHSLVGHLGNTDPAGLLQSLASNRENGVLSVEFKDRQFRAIFEAGKLAKAKESKLRGNQAVVEFVSVWKEGVFVFLERQPPADLADASCAVTRPIDKLLLDSALSQDNIATVLKKLPKGPDTVLEKVEDVNKHLESGQMVDPQEGYALNEDDVNHMVRFYREFDGLASLAATIKKVGELTTSQATTAVARLMHYGLVRIPESDLSGPLGMFQSIVSAVASRVGVERCNALLRLSLQASIGYSAKARMFQLGSSCEIGLDLSLARMAGVSLTDAIKQIEDWQVSFIEYVSQEMDKNLLRDIVSAVYREAEEAKLAAQQASQPAPPPEPEPEPEPQQAPPRFDGPPPQLGGKALPYDF